MNTAGFSINALTIMTASPDATETRVLNALAELTSYFQEDHDFPALLRQIQKYALLRLGMVLPDLHDCSGSLLDSSDSLLSLPSAWLSQHLRNFSTAPFSSCIKFVTDITAVAQVFCGGDVTSATRLIASDPAHWPYALIYDLLSLSLTPDLTSHGSARPFGPPTAEVHLLSPERLRRIRCGGGVGRTHGENRGTLPWDGSSTLARGAACQRCCGLRHSGAAAAAPRLCTFSMRNGAP